MEVQLQPEKQAQLAPIAAQRGTDPGELVQHVLSRYLEDDTHFVEAVNLELAAAARGGLRSRNCFASTAVPRLAVESGL